MKYAIIQLAMIFAMLGVVGEFQTYTMEQTQTQVEDLMMRDLTSEEVEALTYIDALMEEVFVNTLKGEY